MMCLNVLRIAFSISMPLSIVLTAYFIPKRLSSLIVPCRGVSYRGGFRDGGGFIFLPLTMDDDQKVRKIADASIPDLLTNSGIESRVYQTVSTKYLPRHVSLSKTFYIDDHPRKSLLPRLQPEVKRVFHSSLSVSVDSNHLKIMHNEMKTRSYIVLTINDEHPVKILNELTQVTNEILQEMDAPKYFDVPEFHVTLGYVPYNEHLQIIPVHREPETIHSAVLTLQTIVYYNNDIVVDVDSTNQ